MDEEILIKYLRNECNDEEISLVEKWYDESPENKQLLEEIYYTLIVGDISKTMTTVDTEQSLKEFKLKSSQHSHSKVSQTSFYKLRRSVAMVAAFIAGLLVMGSLAYVTQIGQSKSIYSTRTEPGQRAQVELPDGTMVWLNASTTLSYKTSFWGNERQVDLAGEAYFEVAHNKFSEFVVSSKDVKTRVLGTKFNIRARDNEDKVVTTLFEGSVRVNPKLSEKEEHLLKPGQTIDITTDPYHVTLTEYDQPDDVLLWIKGRLTFKQNSLLEITRIFEKLYDVQFVFEDDAIKEERFTGGFSTDGTPEEMLDILKLTNHFNFKKEGSCIYISK